MILNETSTIIVIGLKDQKKMVQKVVKSNTRFVHINSDETCIIKHLRHLEIKIKVKHDHNFSWIRIIKSVSNTMSLSSGIFKLH